MNRPELAANRCNRGRSQRGKRTNSWAFAHRAVANSAARDRRLRMQGWLLESISEALVAQGALLGRVAAGLHQDFAGKRQMKRARGQRRCGRTSRRQPCDNLLPQKWLISIVEEVNVGVDGKVRVAAVRTTNGVFKRPIHKLAPLPIEVAGL